MGNTQAAGMAEAVTDGLIELRQAVSWHLTANHYPPIGEYTDVVVETILAVKSGELSLDSTVDLGLDTFRMLPTRAFMGEDTWLVQVSDLFEATHAWFFLED